MNFKAHLFICTNGPDKEGKCGHKGGEKLRQDLKERCREAFGKTPNLRVNSSGCLGQCENGIAAVIYPQGKWFLNLGKKDGDVLFAEMQRLMRKEKFDK